MVNIFFVLLYGYLYADDIQHGHFKQ